MFFGKRFNSYHSGSISGLELLVLSIIKNRNGISGYDIIQEIDAKFKGMWRASAGTIYPLLSRLSDKNYVSIEQVIENNRLKKLYHITDKGINELQNTLNSNFRRSIDSLGDYIQTVIKAIPRFEKNVDVMFCGFPFHACTPQEEVDPSDLSQSNISRIQKAISDLKKTRNKLLKRVEIVENQIKKHRDLLEKIEEEREKTKKEIKIEEE
ncbi:MAG: PadR family transcriptional regulator [Candidatus Lokiarchaeota archaeon]|jgi:DNA-binding PadR family transcriptional regulator